DEEGLEDVFLALEMAVDGGAGDARGGPDRIHPGGVEAVALEQLDGRVEDLVAPMRPALLARLGHIGLDRTRLRCHCLRHYPPFTPISRSHVRLFRASSLSFTFWVLNVASVFGRAGTNST